MAVVIWTSTDKANYLRRVSKPVFSVTGTDHRTLVSCEDNDTLPKIDEGDVLVAMGGKCLDVLKAAGVVVKNRTIKSLREKRYDFPPGSLLLSHDPGIIEVDAGREPEIVYDLQLACRLHDTGSMNPQIGKYRWVENFDKAIKQVERAHKKTGLKVYVACDLETVGLDPLYKSEYPWVYKEGEEEPEDYRPDARILTISFTVKEGTAYVYRVPDDGAIPSYVHDQIKWLLASEKIKTTGANLKFDMGWIKVHWGIGCTNQKFDTGIVGCLKDESRSNSLNLHAKIYTSMGGYDDEFNQNNDKGRMDLALRRDPDSFLTYAGGDTDACLRVTHRMRLELMQDRELMRFYSKLLQPASAVFAKLEHRGVYVDSARYDELELECTAELIQYHNAGLSEIPRKLRIKFEAEPLETTADKLSLTRPTLIKEFLFTKRGLNLKPTEFTEKAKERTWQYASTKAEHLEAFRGNEDAAQFIEYYSGFNGAKKTLSTYILGFRKHLRSDGMFHPTYNLYRGDFGGSDDDGAVTGRTSARDPAYQTTPKHTKWASRLRSVYIAPPGYAILKLDYSQGELRVAACVANETNMIEAYRGGIDMHLKTGAEVYGIPLKKALKWLKKKDDRVKSVRQGGKAGNFGLLYAMTAAGFVNYAWTTYGVEISLEDATKFRNAFFEMYPGLVDWHEAYKGLARRDLMVRNPLGRIRHLPLINSRGYKVRAQAERQSINSPIQSCLSDMMLLAMVLIDRQYPNLHMFGMTHDEVQIYVPIHEVGMWAQRLGGILENLPLKDFGWEPQLSFPVDAEWSETNLAECVSISEWDDGIPF